MWNLLFRLTFIFILLVLIAPSMAEQPPDHEISLAASGEILLNPEKSFFSIRIEKQENSFLAHISTETNCAACIESDTRRFISINKDSCSESVSPDTMIYLLHLGSTFAFKGQQGLSNGCFMNPTHIAADKLSRIYVSDTGNDRIQILDSNGVFLSQFGSFGVPFEETESENEILNTSTLASFNQPKGIVLATEIFVADSENHRIMKFDRFGNLLRHFGKFGNGRNDLDTPTDVGMDEAKNMYVLDRENHRIKKYDLSGYQLARIGTYGQAPGQMIRPSGLSCSGNRLCLIDSGNLRLQMFDTNGSFLKEMKLPKGFKTDRFHDLKFLDPFILLPNSDQIIIMDSSMNRLFEKSYKGVSEFFDIACVNNHLVLTDYRKSCLVFIPFNLVTVKISGSDS